MKLNFITLMLSSLIFINVHAELNSIGQSIRIGDYKIFTENLSTKKLSKKEITRLLKLVDRTITYRRKKLYAAKSLFKLSKKQSIMLIKSLLLAITTTCFLSGGVSIGLAKSDPFPLLLGTILGAGLGIGSLVQLIKIFRYPNKLQKQFNTALTMEQDLLKIQDTCKTM